MHDTDVRRERLLGRLVLCTLVWAGLHAVTAVRNFITLFDCGFDGFAPMSIALGLVYLLSLLAVDVLTFITASKTAARVFMKFWAVCGALAALSLWDVTADLLTVPILLLTPSLPLSWLREWMEVFSFTVLVILMCLIEFAYMAWLYRRAVKKGALPDGPVDPGAEAVGSGL